jgi:ubiquinone/menaquinone biosynthesis C-methylase UbiE
MPFSRSISPELLDASATGRPDPAELAHNLRDMARYDRWLGAYDLTWKLAAQSLAPHAGWSGLDIGVGSAGFIRYASLRAPMRWLGLDLSPDVLHIARACAPGTLWLCADAARLPLADQCVDIVTCMNTLHHLDESQAVALLAECARVTRRRFVILDLARGYASLAGAWLLTRITSHNRMTLADGVQSVRRAYTPGEATALTARARLAETHITRHGPVHYSIVWTRESARRYE